MEVLVGYIAEVNNSPDEESFNGDEDEEFGFMDLDDSHEAVKTRNAQLRFVNLQPGKDSNRQGVQRLRGIFPLTAPWLQVTARCQLVHTSNSPYWRVIGFPSYCLRTDERLPSDKVLELMLTRWLELDPCAVNSFVAFIDRNPALERARRMDAGCIKEAMRQYCSDWLDASPSYAIRQQEDAWKYQIWCKTSRIPPDIEVATTFPAILSRLPLLLPRQVFGILKKSNCFEALHHMLLSRPWELAFFQITKRLLLLNLPEVPLERFRDAGLLDSFPKLYRDAVQIYAALNRYCNSGGHTYALLDKLLLWANVRDAAAAVSYLVENHIIVLEKRSSCTNVYPWRLHMAEASLCELIAELCLWSPPWTFHFNGDDASFSRIRKDRYQMKAATAISKKPVVVVNGRGGTGKTETMQSITSAATAAIVQEQLTLEAQHQKDVVQRLVSKRRHRRSRNEKTRSSPNGTAEKSQGCLMVYPITDHYSGTTDFGTLDAGRTAPLVPHCSSSSSNESSLPLAADSDIRNGGFGEGSGRDAVPMRETSSMEWDFDGECDEEIDVYLSQAAEELEERLREPTTRQQPVRDDLIDVNGASYILLVAPTGRAAKVLSKRTGWPAYTIHQVINYYEEWRRRHSTDNCTSRTTKSSQPGTSQFKFASVRILVVDECSLVSVQIIARLLRILKAEAKDGIGLRRLILLGDVDQLPSVQPGNFFEDVSVALDKVNHCCVTLMNNHRSEGSLLFENAIRIATRNMPRFSNEHNFKLWPVRRTDSVTDKLGFPARKRMCVDEPCNVPGGALHKTSADLPKVIESLLDEKEMQDHVRSQFIAFRRADCNLINDICCRHYNKHERYCNGRQVFAAGDKVCCRKNAHIQLLGPTSLFNSTTSARRYDIKCVEIDQQGRGSDNKSTNRGIATGQQQGKHGGRNTQPESGDSKKDGTIRTIRLCNGEVFFITQIITRVEETGRSRSIMHLQDEEGEELEVYTKEIIRDCSLAHAWARTIHTFQGSEVDTIAYVLGATAGRQTWQHVYTAITRGRRHVHIVADESQLQQAVARDKDKRYSSLKRRLVQRLCYPGACVGSGSVSSKFVGSDTVGHDASQASAIITSEPPQPTCGCHQQKVDMLGQNPFCESCRNSDLHNCITSPSALRHELYNSDQATASNADSRQLLLPLHAPTTVHSLRKACQQPPSAAALASHAATGSFTNSPSNRHVLPGIVAANDDLKECEFESDCSFTDADDIDNVEFESSWSSTDADNLDDIEFESDCSFNDGDEGPNCSVSVDCVAKQGST